MASRFAYPFYYQYLNAGLSKEEWLASRALLGVIRGLPSDAYEVAEARAKASLDFADVLATELSRQSQDAAWGQRAAFPISNKSRGKHKLRYPGLTMFEWASAILLTGVIRGLRYPASSLAADCAQTALGYAGLLGGSRSKSALPYQGQQGLPIQDRVKAMVSAELVSITPKPKPEPELTDVASRLAKMLVKGNYKMRHQCKVYWFLERMSPWLAYTDEPGATVGQIESYSRSLANRLGISYALAYPSLEYQRGEDYAILNYGLSIREWVAGVILGGFVLGQPKPDVVELAISQADTLITTWQIMWALDGGPDDPAFPMQVGYGHPAYKGIETYLWLSAQIMAELCRGGFHWDSTMVAQAAEYAVVQSQLFFVEIAKRERGR